MITDMPTATINLLTLTHNVARIRSYLTPTTQLLCAIKANAYGHGAVQVAKHLAGLGVGWFGVATPEEALELRSAGITGEVLLFNPVYDGLDRLLEHQVTFTVVGGESLKALQQAVIKTGKQAKVHLKVDTGMGRLGYPPAGILEPAKELDSHKEFYLEALWTHFACADDEDKTMTLAQLERFNDAVSLLEAHGIEVPLKHCANSSAIFAFPESHFNLVRPGIALHGYHSSPYIASLEPQLKPTLTLSAPVTFIKRIGAGTTLSYGASWTAPHDTTIATVRIGYADGYPRSLGNKAQVNIQGQLKGIVGRVCMDQLMVNVGDVDVQIGDEVILFGADAPTAETLGQLAGTVSYEMLTSLGTRVKRVYEKV